MERQLDRPESDPGRGHMGAGVPALGHLERVDVRSVWVNEERDFTPWLLAHTDDLGESLGIDLELDVAEHPVGPFELDLLGRDLTNGTTLIIENQLEPTDHDHFGKTITYAAGTDASTVIWIATRFNEQHRQAITWLNERTGEETSFFAVEIELLRIGDSPPAPHFSVVAAPNEWQKRARDASRASRASAGKGAAYAEFWAKLVSRVAQERSTWTRRRILTNAVYNWLDMPSAVPLASFVLSFARGGRLQEWLSIAAGTPEENLRVFRALEAERETLEREFGRTLEFDELVGQKGCRVTDYTTGDVSHADEHERYIDWFVDSGDRWRKALDAISLDIRYASDAEPVEALPTSGEAVDLSGSAEVASREPDRRLDVSPDTGGTDEES